MSKWYLVRQTKARTNKTPEGIDSLLEFSNKLESEGRKDRYTDSTEGTLFNWRYKWTVQPGEGDYEICEKIYVTSNWFLISSFLLIFSLLILIAAFEFEGISALITGLFSVILLFLYTISTLLPTNIDSPLKDFFKNQPDQISFYPYFSFQLVFAPSVVITSLYYSEQLYYLFVLGAVTLISIYYIFHEKIEDYSVQWQETFFKSLEQMPSVVFHYNYLVLMISAPPFLYVFSVNISIFRDFLGLFPFIITIFYACYTLLILGTIISKFREDASVGKTSHQRYGSDTPSKWVLYASAGFTVFIALTLGYLSLQVFWHLGLVVFIASVIPGLLITGFSITPILILISGFVYQFWSLLLGLYQVEQKIQQQDLGENYQPSVSTYLLENDGYFAGSVFLVWEEAIVVSEGLAEELSSEELDAIIAHEDSHVVEQEAKMTVLIALLSPLFLVGKNVAYVWLNFRSREYRADRFAAEKTSPEQLVGALERLQILKAEKKTESDRVSAVTPTMMPLLDEEEEEDDDSLMKLYFDYFFGDFAVTEVHPNLGDRIKQIRDEQELDKVN